MTAAAPRSRSTERGYNPRTPPRSRSRRQAPRRGQRERDTGYHEASEQRGHRPDKPLRSHNYPPVAELVIQLTGAGHVWPGVDHVYPSADHVWLGAGRVGPGADYVWTAPSPLF